MVIRPTTGALAEHLASAARWVGEILARGGRRGWIVGGTVRDLARGDAPKDVDMASAAPPDEIERLFPRAIGVGRAFGTMIVVTPSADIELTTFRSESGYGDARRPDVESGEDDPDDAALPVGQKTLFTARIDPRFMPAVGTRRALAVDAARLHFFDPSTGAALATGPGESEPARVEAVPLVKTTVSALAVRAEKHSTSRAKRGIK